MHHRLITYACDQVQGTLPKPFLARVEERVVVESFEGTPRAMIPDLHIVKKSGRLAPATSATATLEVAEPMRFQIDDQVTQGFIKIIDPRSGNRLITVIEFISLSNKLAGDGRQKYLKKQRDLRQAEVNSVEIDLLRSGGRRLLPVPARSLPAEYRTAYQAWVRYASDTSVLDVYAIPLRQRLPTIRIPLQPEETTVPLDLQAVVDQVYLKGVYAEDLDYENDPDPGLDPEDARWAVMLLRKQGLRKRGRNGRSTK